jgi:hypothetical protein
MPHLGATRAVNCGMQSKYTKTSKQPIPRRAEHTLRTIMKYAFRNTSVSKATFVSTMTTVGRTASEFSYGFVAAETTSRYANLH